MGLMKKSPSLATTVGGIPLSTCVYNASGPRTGTSAALSKIAASAAGAVLAKSATVAKQTGNPMPRTWHADTALEEQEGSLNSEGLPNAGIDYYLDDKTVEESVGSSSGSSSKPYMVSISGKTLEDNLAMLKLVQSRIVDEGANIAAVELNLACPNVIGKPIIAFDFEQMESVLRAVSAQLHSKPVKLGVKMPPYFDGPHFEAAAAVLNRYADTVSYVASINTVGNALAVDAHAEMPVIASNQGFAGLSGPAVKYTALANVRRMRELLSPTIDVVGVGGVSSGRDAFEMILCGAHAVQVGTCHWVEGPGCFDRICDELRDVMAEKGYDSVDDFRGKIKVWSKDGAMASRKHKQARKKKSGVTTPQLNSSNKNSSSRGGDISTPICAALIAVVAGLMVDERLGTDALKNTTGNDDVYMYISAILICAISFLLKKQYR